MAMGNGLAAIHGVFSWGIAILSILTAVSLQILSNFANDYGDSIHGADSKDRKGPSRAVQAGVISLAKMELAIIIWIIISLLLGSALILTSLHGWPIRIFFWILGVLAIWAAINYTAGKNPYGYKGQGDISVFIFFGLLAVLGCYFLQTNSFDWHNIFPAISCGLLSVAVLNVNNIRDIPSDQLAGKQSIAVKIGREAALKYHASLLIITELSACAYILQLYHSPLQFLFLLSSPFFYFHYSKISNTRVPEKIDPLLKKLVLTIALFVILFLLGNLL